MPRPKVFLAALAALAALLPLQASAVPADVGDRIGVYRTGLFDEGAAEIVSYDTKTHRVYVINAAAATVDVLDIGDPTDPTLVDTLDATLYGAGINSVAVHNGLIALAVEADPATDPGAVVFFDRNGSFLGRVEVGALPDMITFTPNGRYVLTANEGEPESYCEGARDPEGSVSIIDLHGGIARLDQSRVTTAHFRRFNGRADLLNARGVRIYGPGATVAQDLEPEYIATSKNGRSAWISLQENNAIGLIDIKEGKITSVRSLGLKDHLDSDNSFDPSDEDGSISIDNWPVRGMYQPDALSAVRSNGKDYVVTANEGDAREYDCFAEETTVGDETLDPDDFPDAAQLQTPEQLGNLKMSVTSPTNAEAERTEIHAFGGRSFSILNSKGTMIWDSGSSFEQITAEYLPDEFNSTNDENDSFDSRSPDKGPEPEGLATGKIGPRDYAFIGLERIGGVMVFDITDLGDPSFVTYFNSRNFSGDPLADTAGDLGPEGLYFIGPSRSPNGRPLLVVGHEVSGSTAIYDLTGL
ncbi:MAG: choice-of-anchor I family protein [Actinomycetota bacterium]|nr:choice-of-anchor I family protein [Actinomycetota bacterium]